MNKKIIQKLSEISTRGRIGLMTHVVAGFPDFDTCQKIIQVMEQAGADFIEIQIPFSDPLADGPVIMHANEVALQNGMTTRKAFQLMKAVKVRIPLFFMAYYNTIFQYGVERFVADAALCGACGFIIPDLPPEESHEYIAACKKYGVSPIYVIAPTSTEKRLRLIRSVASDFVYLTARTGITGNPTQLGKALNTAVSRVRRIIDLPIACGFGISSKKHVDYLQGLTDIAVIGSALLPIMEGKKSQDLLQSIASTLHALQH